MIISDAGVQRERAFYSPYGRVFGMPAGDLNFDGEFTSAEATTISGWSAAYRAYADVNLDGVIDGDDATANSPGVLGWDALSRDGSTIGYAGYVQDSYIPTLSHVRHRVYKSDLGRWVHRDPAGYVDGANLYQYAGSTPIYLRDPSGLDSTVELPTCHRGTHDIRVLCCQDACDQYLAAFPLGIQCCYDKCNEGLSPFEAIDACWKDNPYSRPSIPTRTIRLPQPLPVRRPAPGYPTPYTPQIPFPGQLEPFTPWFPQIVIPLPGIPIPGTEWEIPLPNIPLPGGGG